MFNFMCNLYQTSRVALTPMIYKQAFRQCRRTEQKIVVLCCRFVPAERDQFCFSALLFYQRTHYTTAMYLGSRFRKSLSLLNFLYRFFNYDCTLQK